SLIVDPRIVQPNFEDQSISKRYIEKEMISIALVTFISVTIPFFIFFCCFRHLNLDITNEIQFYVVFITNFFLVSAIIENLKNLVGRLRPDFIERCIPIKGVCTGKLGRIKEGRKSFPSGHTGTSVAGFLFLCLFLNFYISTDTQRDTRSKIYKCTLICFILLIPTAIGLSRFYDNRHFISDVLSGALISILTSFFLFNFYGLKLIKTQTPETQIKNLD
ncbi:Lipid phosphate phosphatase 2, partial [Nosema bombycis CQ1]